MAPSLQPIIRDIGSLAIVAREITPNTEPGKTWILVAIIGGIIVLIAMAVFPVTWVLRRQQRARQHKTTDPYQLPHHDFSRRRKLNKLSDVDRSGEEEEQRTTMIRKSLAGRSSRQESTSSFPRFNSPPPAYNEDSDSEDSGDLSRPGLRDDWKAFEAQVRRERSSSRELHPAAAGRDAWPTAPERTVARERSSSQSSLLGPGAQQRAEAVDDEPRI